MNKIYASYIFLLTKFFISLGPATPSSLNSRATNASIEITFAMLPNGTIMRIVGSGPTMLSEDINDGTTAVFTNILLGDPYNFTLVAIDSNEVMSAEAFLLNVMGKMLLLQNTLFLLKDFIAVCDFELISLDNYAWYNCFYVVFTLKHTLKNYPYLLRTKTMNKQINYLSGMVQPETKLCKIFTFF